jgi:hypothetical protein
MFTYRLHLADGSDIGEATYPSNGEGGRGALFWWGRRFDDNRDDPDDHDHQEHSRRHRDSVIDSVARLHRPIGLNCPRSGCRTFVGLLQLEAA